MPWFRVNGIDMHVKMAKPRRRNCSAATEGGHPCERAALYQCDYKVGADRTCDAYTCLQHANTVGPDVHHCQAHALRQQGLFTTLVGS